MSISAQYDEVAKANGWDILLEGEGTESRTYCSNRTPVILVMSLANDGWHNVTALSEDELVCTVSFRETRGIESYLQSLMKATQYKKE